MIKYPFINIISWDHYLAQQVRSERVGTAYLSWAFRMAPGAVCYYLLFCKCMNNSNMRIILADVC